MATLIYALCAITSAMCALLLIREYRLSRVRLLLWSSVAFVGLALNNLLVFADFVVVPDIDLLALRVTVALVSVALLLAALIWDAA